MHTVTGYSGSRLSELRKYVVVGSLSEIYTISTDVDVDGLDLTKTVTGISNSTYVYYIGSITYVDTVIGDTSQTHFTLQSLGLYDTNNFDDMPYIKIEEKQNIVENPNITKDVKVVRQEIPVFEQAIRLRAVETLNDILVYGGGKFFTVHNNT
jgi:hypothetical protein